MIIKFTALLRNSGRTLLLAGIFSAASAFANPQVATPNFSPASGVYSSAQSVTITSATSDASIAYTTDGSIPTVSAGTVTHGTLYNCEFKSYLPLGIFLQRRQLGRFREIA
jgi:hypothetical protein